MQKHKNAFTLVETLIMMAVIGILATVTAVSLKGMRPDKDKMLIKKSYSQIVQAVHTLINDRELYPYAHIAHLLREMSPLTETQSALENDEEDSENELTCEASSKNNCISNEGLFDTVTCTCIEKSAFDAEDISTGLPQGNFQDRKTQFASANSGSGKFSDVTVRCTDNSYTSDDKFAYNFMKIFETTSSECENNECKFTTPDGMYWEVEDQFNNSSLNYAIIKVDINGQNTGSNSSTDTDPDVYSFKVDADGAASVYGSDAAATKAVSVLKSRDIKAD